MGGTVRTPQFTMQEPVILQTLSTLRVSDFWNSNCILAGEQFRFMKNVTALTYSALQKKS
jgi:hypothetical protein